MDANVPFPQEVAAEAVGNLAGVILEVLKRRPGESPTRGTFADATVKLCAHTLKPRTW